jgi:hypothetical protein
MKKLCVFATIVGLLLLVHPLLSCPYDTGGHLVNIRSIDASDVDIYGFKWYNPIQNATITVTGIQKEQPFWLWEMFGITTDTSQIDLIPRKGTTDKYGVATLALYDTMLYNVTITCSNGKTTAFKLYPHENEYTIYTGC